MQKIAVSVIVPVYNSSKTLRKTVESLLNQNFPKNLYEIILVDDGSTDGSLDVISDLTGKSQVNVKMIRLKTHRGCFSARNEGIKSSHGQLIAFIDSDMVASPSWLDNLVKPLMLNRSLGAVCGRVLSDENSILISPVLVSTEGATRIDVETGRTGTGNICYRKEVLQLLGGFDERFDPRFRGDSDLGLRAVDAGFKLGYAANAIAHHPIVKTRLLKVPKDFFKHNKDVLLYAKHGRKASSLLGGFMTRPILGPLSPFGMVITGLIVMYAILPLTLIFTLVAWFPFFIIYGYKLVSKNPKGRSIPLGLRIKASIAYPLSLFTIYAARVYGSIKYRKLLL